MNVTATTTYTLAIYQALCHLPRRGRRGDPGKMMITALILALVTAGISLYEMIAFGWRLIAIPVLAALLIVLLCCGWYFWFPRHHYKLESAQGEVSCSFVFGDTVMSFTTLRNGAPIRYTEMPYTSFCRVVETSTYFFLFLSDRSACVVDKATFSGGTVEMVRAALYRCIPDRYELHAY